MAMFDQKCWISPVIGGIKSTAFPSRQFVSLTDLINIQKLTVAAEIRERISEGKSKIKKSTSLQFADDTKKRPLIVFYFQLE